MMKKSKFFLIFLVLVSKSEAKDVIVQCLFHETSNYEHHGLQSSYECYIRNQNDFIDDQVKIVGVSRTHKNGKSDDNVQVFNLQNASNLTKIPSNIEKRFKNLLLLRIENSSITEITGIDIKALKNLKYLWLAFNKIKVVRNDLFINHPQMEMIALVSCEITHIDRDTFTYLNELKQLYLDGNPCGSLYYVETRKDVLKVIERIKNGECESAEYITTTTTTTTSTTENPLNVKILEQQQQIDKLKRQQEILKVEIAFCENDLKQQFINFTAENQQLTQKISTLNEEIKKSQTIREIIEDSLENGCIGSYHMLTEKFIQLNEKCDAKVTQCESKIKQHETKMEKCEFKIEKYEERIEKCEMKVDKYEAKIEIIESNKNQEKEKSELKMKHCESKMENCEEKIQDFEVNSNKSNKKCEGKIDILNDQVSTLSGIIKTLEDQLKLQTILLEDKNGQYNELKKEWDKLEQKTKKTTKD